MLKGLGAQVFSSIHPIREGGARKRRKIEQVNDWMHSWCHAQGLGFYSLGHTFEKPGLLTVDGAQMTKWGKSVLGNKLDGLRALN